MSDDPLNARVDGYVHHQVRKSRQDDDASEELALMLRVAGAWESPDGFTELSRMGEIVAGRGHPRVLESLRTDPRVLSIETPRGPGRYE